MDIKDLRTQQKQVTDHRPKAITFHLEIHSTQDGASNMAVPADIAFIAEDFWWTPENDTPLITQDSNINPDELTDLMMKSLFHESDNIDDSYNTQKDDAWSYLRALALATIVSKEESVKIRCRRRYRQPPCGQAAERLASDHQHRAGPPRNRRPPPPDPLTTGEITATGP